MCTKSRPVGLLLEISQCKNLCLQTNLGQLDVLGSLRPIEDPAEVFRDAIWIDIGGLKVRVVSLAHLLRVKASMGRPKDKVVGAELRVIAELDEG